MQWVSLYLSAMSNAVTSVIHWVKRGSRCQAHRFVSRTATLLDFSCSIVSRVYEECSTNQRTADLTQLREALESTWTSIPVERFRHLVQSMPRLIEAVLRAKGGECNSILGSAEPPSVLTSNWGGTYTVIFPLFQTKWKIQASLTWRWQKCSIGRYCSSLSPSTVWPWSTPCRLIQCIQPYLVLAVVHDR